MYTKSASPEFIGKLLRSIGVNKEVETKPVHIPKKPDFNPTGIQDMGVGAGIGAGAAGLGAAATGGMAHLKQKSLFDLTNKVNVTLDATRLAADDILKVQDPKMQALMYRSLIDRTKGSLNGFTEESKRLATSIPSLIKYRNLILKLGIPAGVGLGALGGFAHYKNRPAV